HSGDQYLGESGAQHRPRADRRRLGARAAVALLAGAAFRRGAGGDPLPLERAGAAAVFLGGQQELDRVAVDAGLDEARDLLRLRAGLGPQLVVDVQREAGPFDLQAPAAPGRQHAEALAVLLPVLEVIQQPLALLLADEHDVELAVPRLAVVRQVQV